MDRQVSEDYLKILEVISDIAIIAYTDKQGRITFANKKFCEISGYSLEELRNKDHRILNSGHHHKDFFAEMYKTIKAGKLWRGEVCNKNKDGSYYWVDTQVFPITGKDNQITGYASIRFDITERKNMQSSLLQLEKLASIGELAAVIAHEINNPLTVIDLSTRAIFNEVNNGDIDIARLEMKINKIIKSTNQISKIVRGLKTISRNGESDESFTLINLKTFLEDALSFSIAKCRQNEIIFKIGNIPDIQVECRPDQISQILLNLINNSQDAVSNNEERWIELSIDYNKDLNLLVISVIDSGKGIPETIEDKILNPFFTTKEVGKGTGLGLSISSSIAAKHNGKLYYEKKGPNTSFVLEIPLSQSEFMPHKLEA